MRSAERADVVVIGAGLLGLATAHALRDRREVVVIEQATVGHRRGGSHGPSRIFRLGYDDPRYVRMAMRALEGWDALEAEADATLLHRTGQLTFGRGRRAVLRTLEECGAPGAELTADQVAARFPAFAGHGGAVYEPSSAVIAAGEVLDTYVRLAACDVRTDVRVRRVDDRDNGVRVETENGAIDARVAVVCAGPWTPRLCAVPTHATLEHVAYFAPRDDVTVMPPIFIAFDEPAVYGLPTPHEPTYKLARHHAGATVDAEATDLAVDAIEVDELRAAARHWLPQFDDDPVAVDTCLYDNTASEDFVLERRGHVVVGAGTSGHGFKFGPVFGAELAALVLEQ